MIEQKIKVFSESLARGVDRRTFLKRMGGAVVAGISAIVVGPALITNVRGTSAQKNAPVVPTISCSPPGPYCSVNGQPTDGCRGGHCYKHGAQTCWVFYNWYTTGCWTTAQGGGYWTCCDCACSGGSWCGCAQFNPGSNPSPH